MLHPVSREAIRSLAPKSAAARASAGAGKGQRYATVKVLGRGAFGTAYLVRRKADSFLYVMKKPDLEQLAASNHAEKMWTLDSTTDGTARGP